MENQAAVAAPEKKVSLFSIKPYGDNLCTPGARYWISCIRLVIIVMALSEAIAWAYLGSLFGKGVIGYVAAGIAFLFVFTIIWIIDVSFVTLDISKAHYDNEILKKKTSTWVDNLLISIGLIGRVAIVVVSLSISAPFIAQIVFMQDIDNEMEGRNLARVSVVSDSLIAQKDAEVAALDSLILAKEQELIVETAGQGASGNYGFGPVTQAMERNIQRLKDERAQQLAEKDEMIDAFAALSIEEFAQRYNVDLVDNGVQARSAILTALSENPEYKTAKRAITAFLAFIFAALVLLKLFQPRSVRIYYNEKLQDLYKEYLSGNLNRWISKEEQLLDDGRSQISPLRFEDWSINTYGVIRNEDIKRRESSKMYNSFKIKIDQLENEKDEVKKMLDPIEKEYEEIVTELNGLRVEVMKADNAVEQNERVAEDIQRQIESIHADLRNGSFKGQDLVHAVQAKKSTEDRLAQHAEAALQLKYDQDIANHRYDIKKEEVDQLEELMSKVRSNYRYIQEKIDDERLKYTEMIVSGKIVGGDFFDVTTREVVINEEQDEPGLLAGAENEQLNSAELHESVVSDSNERDSQSSQEEQEQEASVTGFGVINEEKEAVADEIDKADEIDDADEEKDPFAEPYSQDYLDDDTMYDDVLYDDAMYDNEPEYYDDEPEYDSEVDEERESNQERINRFIWDDDEYVQDRLNEMVQDDDEEEEEAEREAEELGEKEQNEDDPEKKSYTHYPLLVGGMEEEKEDESPVEYVDTNELERYADSVSLAAYEAASANGESEKYNENTRENEEGKSDNSMEVFSPGSTEDEPEEMEVEPVEKYSEDRHDDPVYFWDEMESEAADLSDDNDESKRTTYAWDALESTYPDQTESKRDEIVEEGTEEEDQSADTTDLGEAEAPEDITDDNEPEAQDKRTRDPKPRRKVVLKRRLGRTGDWMIG